jgi:heterodisulfide reductase subunit A-like polyferredoxin
VSCLHYGKPRAGRDGLGTAFWCLTSVLMCIHQLDVLELREIKAEMEINILLWDMRTYGLMEDYYRQASEKQVEFILSEDLLGSAGRFLSQPNR